jgi:hypothetical protein
MQPLIRTRRQKFIYFKKQVSMLFGGRAEFKKKFPSGDERKKVYDSLLYKKGIAGGERGDIDLNISNEVLCTLFA